MTPVAGRTGSAPGVLGPVATLETVWWLLGLIYMGDTSIAGRMSKIAYPNIYEKYSTVNIKILLYYSEILNCKSSRFIRQ